MNSFFFESVLHRIYQIFYPTSLPHFFATIKGFASSNTLTTLLPSISPAFVNYQSVLFLWTIPSLYKLTPKSSLFLAILETNECSSSSSNQLLRLTPFPLTIFKYWLLACYFSNYFVASCSSFSTLSYCSFSSLCKSLNSEIIFSCLTKNFLSAKLLVY